MIFGVPLSRRVFNFSLAAGIVSPATGCGPTKLPDFTASSAAGARLVADRGLQVQYYPMTNEEEQKKYFGTNLRDAGIIPVWIQASDGDPDAAYFLDTDAISLADQGRALDSSRINDDPANRAAEKMVGVPSALLFSPIGLMVASAMGAVSDEIRRNMMVKRLYSTTMTPGGSLAGFVYAPVAPDRTNLAGYIIRVVLFKSPRSTADQGIAFTLPM